MKVMIAGVASMHASSSGLTGLRIGNRNHNVYFVFGRFPAELGPETRSNGSGSKNGAERAQKLAPETKYEAVS